MKNLVEIKKEHEANMSLIFEKYGVFFAFSNEQFNENKTTLKEGEKYVSMGLGGYIPKSNLDAYLDAMEANNKAKKQAIKDNKQRKANIMYELGNHEAGYTYDIEDTLNALGSDYSREEVQTVFKEYIQREKQANNI